MKEDTHDKEDDHHGENVEVHTMTPNSNPTEYTHTPRMKKVWAMRNLYPIPLSRLKVWSRSRTRDL